MNTEPCSGRTPYNHEARQKEELERLKQWNQMRADKPIEFTPEEKYELGLAILQAARVDEKLSTMSNKKIGELLFYHVWANMNMLSPQSEVVEQAFLRLGFKPED